MKSAFFLMLTGLMLCAPVAAWAQEPLDEDMPTRMVDKKVKENKRSNFPKEKKIRYIYVKDGGKVLFGNPCATQVTHQMGFEYGIEHRPEKGFRPWWYRFKTNTTTKTILFFTKGPWWRATVNKRFKACAMSSGDRRG
ncbi:hypothetical protein N7E81_05295 [Reichenbachiella carrageenanivorans]|uniref:Uncharacterized protein n=1 Tax=Reichenbachiella carrageenanivorans TaxID=2979869 RepID=A0ABY6D315_9BACT|nr:hypothetical protein [Reichenbachiella carrageenanivorans]UXX80513.1 hypothetical protein N7E81_05295 [Reichenbachiella carrageenanivorans]